ncbi:hypothetical protein GGI42DRAFT_19196 [Trichoderma sp. SZMC 28013]
MCPSHCSWCACGGRANVSLRLAVFVCCTLYILTHAACVGRERQREGQVLCINCPDLAELGLAGWLPFQHRTSYSHRQAMQRCYVDVPSVQSNGTGAVACPCPAILVAPIGRAPSSPTSRFTCMYICDGDHAVRSIDDEEGARDRGLVLVTHNTQIALTAFSWPPPSGSLTLCPLCRQAAALVARQSALFLRPTIARNMAYSCQSYRMFLSTATLAKRGLEFLFFLPLVWGGMFSPVSCHIYTYWWSRQATNSSTMRTCTVTMEGNCAICPRTISLAGGSLASELARAQHKTRRRKQSG